MSKMADHQIDLVNEQVELTAELIAANRAYYTDTPTMTDADFDAKLRRLQELEKQLSPLPGSPTRQVGSDLTGDLPKVKHTAKMLSLDNKFTTAELMSFFQPGDELTVEPKLDGSSLSVVYENGELVVAKTRGDGTYGEDVTANARVIAGIPLTVDYKGKFEVRGEVVMTRSQLTRLNAQRELEGDAPMANCRNAASGSLKQRSPAECARRGLRFISYWTNHPSHPFHTTRLALLDVLGFHSVHTLFDPGIVCGVNDMSSSSIVNRQAAIDSALAELEIARKTLDVDLDGGVFKVNDTRRYAELGEGSKSPKWATAYKFAPEKVTTILEDIVIQIGRTGQVTPVAKLRAVKVSGVTVTSASLMNIDEWNRVGSPRPGDTVTVERSAEVIPRVCGVADYDPSNRVPEKVFAGALTHRWEFPTHCPTCGTEFVRDGVHYFDPNPDCPERIKAYLKHVTSKSTLDWDGMGDKAIERLYDAGFRTLSDLFTISLESVFSGAELSNLSAERERVKTVPLWRKLRALGAEDVGSTHSKTMAQKYGSLASIMVAAETNSETPGTCRVPTESDLAKLIGPVCAKSFYDRVFELNEAGVFDGLTSAGFTFSEAEATGPRPLAGMTFCLTGTLQTSGRDEMTAKIESLGGVVKSSCTKTTTHVVAGEMPGGTKMKAASKFGTKVISEEDLYLLMNEPFTIISQDTVPAEEEWP